MANHVQNVLLVEGQATQAVRKYVQRSENVFDFTTILPLSNASLEEKYDAGERKKMPWEPSFIKRTALFHFKR